MVGVRSGQPHWLNWALFPPVGRLNDEFHTANCWPRKMCDQNCYAVKNKKAAGLNWTTLRAIARHRSARKEFDAMLTARVRSGVCCVSEADPAEILESKRIAARRNEIRWELEDRFCPLWISLLEGMRPTSTQKFFYDGAYESGFLLHPKGSFRQRM